MFFFSFSVLTFYGGLDWHMSIFGRLNIYQTSPHQFYHACQDADDYWFADRKQHIDDSCRQFYLEAGTDASDGSWTKGYTINRFTETIQFFGMNQICLKLDKSLGYVYFDLHKSELFDCEFYLFQGKKLTLDLRLLLPKALIPLQQSAAVVADSACFSLMSIFHLAVQPADPAFVKPFALLTGESSSKERLSLWMSYCDLSPVMISQWHNSLTKGRDSEHERSECAVHRVRGLVKNYSKHSTKLDNQIHCIEDVMNLLASNDMEKTVTYISSLNMPRFPLSENRAEDTNDLHDIDDISDVYRVLRAFQNSEARGLYITGVNPDLITGVNPDVRLGLADRSYFRGNDSIYYRIFSKLSSFRRTMAMFLDSCSDAGSDNVFLEALENFYSVATSFMKDYAMTLFSANLLDVRCSISDPACFQSIVDRIRHVLWHQLRGALADSGFQPAAGNIDTTNCDLQLGSNSICGASQFSRRLLLAHYILRTILPSIDYLDKHGGDSVAGRNWSQYSSQVYKISFPNIMWQYPSMYVFYLMYCKGISLSAMECGALYSSRIDVALNAETSHILISANPDLIHILKLSSSLLLFKPDITSSHNFESTMITWALQFEGILNDRFYLPVDDKFGAGPYDRHEYISCEQHTNPADRYVNYSQDVGISTSMVYVLVFVSNSIEFDAAQRHVHEWKEREILNSNLFVRYNLIMAPRSDTIGLSCSLRYILMFVEQWINDFGTHRDFVVALNGLDGARAFRAPRPTPGKRCPGMIPFLQSDSESQVIHLFAPIVFSRMPAVDEKSSNRGMSSCNLGTSTDSKCGAEYDILDSKAFAGAVSHVRAMVNHIFRRDPSYILKDSKYRDDSLEDDDHLLCALRRFAKTHPVLIGVDINRSYFDHNDVTQDTPYRKDNDFPALRKINAIAPLHYCNADEESNVFDNLTTALVDRHTGVVNTTKLSELDEISYKKIIEGELCFTLGFSWKVYTILKFTDLSWVPIARMYWHTVAFPMIAYNVSLVQKNAALAFLTTKLKKMDEPGVIDLPFRAESRLLHLYMSCLYQEIGPFQLAAKYLAYSVDGAYSLDVERSRKLWSLQRQSYKDYLHSKLQKSALVANIKRVPRELDIASEGSAEPWMTTLGIQRNGREILAQHLARIRGIAVPKFNHSDGVSDEISPKYLGDNVPRKPPQIHVFTLATERRFSLECLEFAAMISGINLKIVGMGQQWNGSADRLPLFGDALLADATVDDNDIVFLIDGYDVLVFPAIRNAVKFFSESPTPIVMCTEIGLYPEQLGGILYRRGDDSDPEEFGTKFAARQVYSRRMARFVNGGCVAGRAAQLKDLLTSYVWPHSYFRDDQMDHGRFTMSNPHLASLDDDRQIMFSSFKEVFEMNVAVHLDFGFVTNRLHHRHTGVLHCNRGSLPVCESAFEGIKAIYDSFYAGDSPDAQLLLCAMRAYWEADYYAARMHIGSLSFNLNNGTGLNIVNSSDPFSVNRRYAAEYISSMIDNALPKVCYT